MIRPLHGRGARIAALVTIAGLGAAGCNFHGAYSLPLPGGASHGKQVVVTAVFDDVQDLVPDSAVRINDVAQGQVTNITLGKDLKAHVTLSVNAAAARNLPANSVATLSQSTLLGEKFIALAPPPDAQPQGQLHSGETLGDGSTDILPDVEQVFGVLSTVLNGGDLADLKTINAEIAKALNGREDAVRGALHNITRFVSDLDSQKQQIVRALDALNRLSGVLAGQTGTIQTALTKLSPGLKVLADTTPQFVRLLQGLSHFGQVTRRLITASRADTVANLRNLQPVLEHLAAAGSNVPHALEILVTYPFPHNIEADAPGDYTGLDLSFCLQATTTQCTQPAVTGPLNALCSLLGALNLGGLSGNCPSQAAVTRPLHPARPHRAAGKSSRQKHKRGLLPKVHLPKAHLPKVHVPKVHVPTPSPTDSGLLGVLGGLGGGNS